MQVKSALLSAIHKRNMYQQSKNHTARTIEFGKQKLQFVLLLLQGLQCNAKIKKCMHDWDGHTDALAFSPEAQRRIVILEIGGQLGMLLWLQAARGFWNSAARPAASSWQPRRLSYFRHQFQSSLQLLPGQQHLVSNCKPVRE